VFKGAGPCFLPYQHFTEANLVGLESYRHSILCPPAVLSLRPKRLGYEFPEPSCIHYKHSKVLLAIYGKKMNAKNISSISLKLLMSVLKT
jgi:hypothetical protein